MKQGAFVRFLVAGMVALTSATLAGKPGDQKPPACTDFAAALAKGNQGIPLPGFGMVDPAQGLVLLPDGKGGLEAIDLSTGHVLWSKGEGSWPLAAADRCLISRSEVADKPSQIRIKVQDLEDGSTKSTSSELSLPEDWVKWRPVLVPHDRPVCDYGYRFEFQWVLEQTTLYLPWAAHASSAGDVPPPPDPAATANKDLYGLFQVSLIDGTAGLISAGPLPVARPTAFDRLPDRLKTLRSRPYFSAFDGGVGDTRPIVVGDRAAILNKEIDGGRERLNLILFDRHSQLQVLHKVLLTGENLIPVLQADGSTLVVTQGIPDDRYPADDRNWAVFSLSTGERTAKIPLSETAGAVQSVDHYFFRRDGDSLAVFDESAGKEIWRTEFKLKAEGPCPPHAEIP